MMVIRFQNSFRQFFNYQFICFFCCLFVAVPQSQAGEEDSTARQRAALELFERGIRPALIKHCYQCHSEKTGGSYANLQLDSQPAMRRGGDSGDILQGNTPDETLLLRALSYDDDLTQMPPDGKLPDTLLDDFRKWIELGAADPRTNETGNSLAITRVSIAEQSEKHWAFLPPKHSSNIGTGVSAHSYSSLIDAHVASRLAMEGISSSPLALPRKLARRIQVALTGLEPTKEELDRFEFACENGQRKTAYLDLVDRLLKSPHFGERWARHWMDVARYSDTKGYVFKEDRKFHTAYKYRDWLIQSFNDDLPFDLFIKEQIAADQLHTSEPETWAAMGFVSLGRRFLNIDRDIADEQIDVVSRGLMGLTVACARCHDHKFDPIGMDDYYALASVFLSCKHSPDESPTRHLVDKETPVGSFILNRGQVGNRGPNVDKVFIRFLSQEPQPLSTGSGRVELAEQIASAKNPLTARVYVNRVWGWMMGSHIVDTPSDFGLQCAKPIYADLLDALAVGFMENGWSTKWLVRQIAISKTYQQTSQVAANSIPESKAKITDPENRLYWKSNSQRLDFESYRDALLLAANQLDLSVGGPSEPIEQMELPQRRTVYAFIDRQNLPEVFRAFDFANPDAHVPKRLSTTVPQQALFALNSQFVQRVALSFTDRCEQITETENVESAIQFLFEKILRRDATSDEILAARTLLNQYVGQPPQDPSATWSYGYASVSFDEKDANAATVTRFQTYPKFANTRWRGDSEPPTEKLGWSHLTKHGGHPGHSLDLVSVRRWIAPRDGTILISGKLKHKSDQGDGVRATIIQNNNEQLGQWSVLFNEVATAITSVTVIAGEPIDFAVDCNRTDSFDTFDWSVRIVYSDDNSSFNSIRDFSTQQPLVSNRWAALAQTLMASNEFIFVD